MVFSGFSWLEQPGWFAAVLPELFACFWVCRGGGSRCGEGTLHVACQAWLSKLYPGASSSLVRDIPKWIIKLYNFCEIKKQVLNGATYEMDFSSSRKLKNKHLIFSNWKDLAVFSLGREMMTLASTCKFNPVLKVRSYITWNSQSLFSFSFFPFFLKKLF